MDGGDGGSSERDSGESELRESGCAPKKNKQTYRWGHKDSGGYYSFNKRLRIFC